MRRVIKVGGSLLQRSDLRDSLQRWLARQRQAESLVIIGGGELVDVMRRLDAIHDVDPVEMHWICVELLETTLRLFAQRFDWPRIVTAEALRHASEAGFAVDTPTLISVSAFYSRQRDAEGVDLPCDWRTTTDAIAALLAHRVGAEELVLLKSCEVDRSASPEQLARAGIVDEAFPHVAPRVPTVRVERL